MAVAWGSSASRTFAAPYPGVERVGVWSADDRRLDVCGSEHVKPAEHALAFTVSGDASQRIVQQSVRSAEAGRDQGDQDLWISVSRDLLITIL
jgi:hypothetical protein